MAEPRIQLWRVSRRYPGGRGLDGISLEIPPGTLTLVTGPSAAGKTTLLRLIHADERPDAGEILVAGRDISRLDPRGLPFFRRNIGAIFQDSRLVRDRTAAENVAIALEVRGVGRREVRVRVAEALERVGLAGAADIYAEQLSGGERQKVAVARALVGEPAIVLADEPTLHLDDAAADDVLALLTEARARGTTVLLATHDPRVLGSPRLGPALRVALSEGRLAAPVGTPPAHPVAYPDAYPGALADASSAEAWA